MKSLVLTNGQSPLTLGFDADVRGTAADETIRVESGTDIEFAAGQGDRVEFPQSVDAYEFIQSGNVLTVANSEGSRAEIALNAATELAFANGSTTADLVPEDGGLAMEVGGERVSEEFATNNINFNQGDASDIGGTEEGDDGSSGEIEIEEKVIDVLEEGNVDFNFDASNGAHRISFLGPFLEGNASGTIENFDQNDQIILDDTSEVDDDVNISAFSIGNDLQIEFTDDRFLDGVTLRIELTDVLDNPVEEDIESLRDINVALGWDGIVAQ